MIEFFRNEQSVLLCAPATVVGIRPTTGLSLKERSELRMDVNDASGAVIYLSFGLALWVDAYLTPTDRRLGIGYRSALCSVEDFRSLELALLYERQAAATR